MRTFSIDNSQFLQPASVYNENNEWFITGVPSQTIINKGPENPINNQIITGKEIKQKGKKQQGKGKGNGKGRNK